MISIFLVQKQDGSIRMCLNPTKLNPYIQRPVHYTKTLDTILPDLQNCRYFSNFDVRSSPLIQSHLFTVLIQFMVGTSSSHTLLELAVHKTFQMLMNAILSQIPDVYNITPDILIASKTQEDHDQELSKFQKIITAYRERVVHLNRDKCHLLRY